MTRRPFTNAIIGAGKVLESTHAQDQAVATTAYQTWKTESENAVKLANYELNAYKAAIAKKGVDVREADAAVKTAISAFQNAPLLKVYQTEGMDGVARYVQTYGKSLKQTTDAQSKFQEHVDDLHSQASALDAWKTANPQAAANPTFLNAARHTIKSGGVPNDQGLPEAKPSAGAGSTSKLSEGAQYDAAVYYLKTHQLPAGFGGQADRDAIENKAHEIMMASGINAGNWPAMVASTKADSASLSQLTKATNAMAGYEQGATKGNLILRSPYVTKDIGAVEFATSHELGSERFGGVWWN